MKRSRKRSEKKSKEWWRWQWGVIFAMAHRLVICYINRGVLKSFFLLSLAAYNVRKTNFLKKKGYTEVYILIQNLKK